jgi:hypothetical protein
MFRGLPTNGCGKNKKSTVFLIFIEKKAERSRLVKNAVSKFMLAQAPARLNSARLGCAATPNAMRN